MIATQAVFQPHSFPVFHTLPHVHPRADHRLSYSKNIFMSKENRIRSCLAQTLNGGKVENALGSSSGSSYTGGRQDFAESNGPSPSTIMTTHHPPLTSVAGQLLFQSVKDIKDKHSDGDHDAGNVTSNPASIANTLKTPANRFRKPIQNPYRRRPNRSHTPPRMPVSPSDLWQIVDESSARNHHDLTRSQKEANQSISNDSSVVYSSELSTSKQSIQIHMQHSSSSSTPAHPSAECSRYFCPATRTMIPSQVQVHPSSPSPSHIRLPTSREQEDASTHALAPGFSKIIGSERHIHCKTNLTPQWSTRTATLAKNNHLWGNQPEPEMAIQQGNALGLLLTPISVSIPPGMGASSSASKVVPKPLGQARRFSPQLIEVSSKPLIHREAASGRDDKVQHKVEKGMSSLQSLNAPQTPIGIELRPERPKSVETESDSSDLASQRYTSILRFNARHKLGNPYAPRFSSTLNPDRSALNVRFCDLVRVERENAGESKQGGHLHWNYFRPVAQRLRGSCETHNRISCRTISSYLRGGDQKHCIGCRRDGMRVRLMIAGLWEWSQREVEKEGQMGGFVMDYWDDEDFDLFDGEENDKRRGVEAKDVPMDVDSLDEEMKRASANAESHDMEVDVDLQFKLVDRSEWDGNVPDSPRLKDLDDFDDL